MYKKGHKNVRHETSVRRKYIDASKGINLDTPFNIKNSVTLFQKIIGTAAMAFI